MNQTLTKIILLLFLLLLVGTGYAQAATPSTQPNNNIPGNFIQGQTTSNGTLYIVSYNTPTGYQYPEPFQSIHANSFVIITYNPNKQTTTQIIIKSIQGSGNKTVTRYENTTITMNNRQVQAFTVQLPQLTGKQEISMTLQNSTTIYYVQTYTPIQFPFGNNPLGLLALVGIIMLLFSAINAGASAWIINKAKHFPKLTIRGWLLILFITGIIIYTIITNYYYDLTGQDWMEWLIPLYIINLISILNAYPNKDQEELLIHIHETQDKDLRTGLFILHTAPLTEEEKRNYAHIPNLNGKEYIDPSSYKDFFLRLVGKRIPINMDSPEEYDKINNPTRQGIKKLSRWTMKDRTSKNHPFAEAYLLSPKQPAPEIIKIAKDKETKTRKATYLQLHLDGKHMQEAEFFLANYITASESGKEIHRLSKALAQTKAELNTKAYQFQQEIIEHIFETETEMSRHNESEYNPDSTETTKQSGDESKNE